MKWISSAAFAGLLLASPAAIAQMQQPVPGAPSLPRGDQQVIPPHNTVPLRDLQQDETTGTVTSPGRAGAADALQPGRSGVMADPLQPGQSGTMVNPLQPGETTGAIMDPVRPGTASPLQPGGTTGAVMDPTRPGDVTGTVPDPLPPGVEGQRLRTAPDPLDSQGAVPPPGTAIQQRPGQ